MDALSADGTGAIIDSEEIAVGAWEAMMSGCNDGVVDGLLVETNKEDKVGNSDIRRGSATGKIVGGNELLDCPC